MLMTVLTVFIQLLDFVSPLSESMQLVGHGVVNVLSIIVFVATVLFEWSVGPVRHCNFSAYWRKSNSLYWFRNI